MENVALRRKAIFVIGLAEQLNKRTSNPFVKTTLAHLRYLKGKHENKTTTSTGTRILGAYGRACCHHRENRQCRTETGGIAHLGIDNENGAQLAINEINAKGDLTIGGQKVILQLVGEDDEGDPRKAGSAALKLYNEGVVAVVGHLNSGVSIPANSIYAAANMVQVFHRLPIPFTMA